MRSDVALTGVDSPLVAGLDRAQGRRAVLLPGQGLWARPGPPVHAAPKNGHPPAGGSYARKNLVNNASRKSVRPSGRLFVTTCPFLCCFCSARRLAEAPSSRRPAPASPAPAAGGRGPHPRSGAAKDAQRGLRPRTGTHAHGQTPHTLYHRTQASQYKQHPQMDTLRPGISITEGIPNDYKS